ncbi:MAG: sirohydrochlorin cobaltochelatase [Acutalibacteraceae bacterium]
MLTFEDDYKACCDIVMKYAPAPKEETALVFMGHGTAHYANASYCQLENTFRALGHEHVYVGTVEGFPNLDYIIGRLKKHNITRVHLMPFMIVAGDHAQNDMAGEEPDSWKSILENEGFQVTVQLDGLGSFPETGQLFASHLDKAETVSKDNFIL